MTDKIKATFVRTRSQDSGSEQPDYDVYEFTDIIDDAGNKYSDKWIKETKLMEAVSFEKGKQYEIKLSRKLNPDWFKLPHPVEIASDNNIKVIKYGGRIITCDLKKGKYFDVSNYVEVDNKFKPISGEKLQDGIRNYNTAARNKLVDGKLTEDLLLKMNSRGVFFTIEITDPQDKRKSAGHIFSYNKKENYILIQKETQFEIDKDLESIKRSFVTKEIEKHFKIKTQILQPKKRK